MAKFIFYAGLMVIFFIGAIFVASAIHHAQFKGFWGDETYGLEGATRSESYAQLLTWGAHGQGSAAPLDYVFIKTWDWAYRSFLGKIPHDIYYRLNSIFWDLTAGILIASLYSYVFYRGTNNAIILMCQLALVCFALTTFYFKKDNMHFAVEMRPYALWNSLWFVMLGLFMLRKTSIWVLFTGVLLAMSSIGALIQIPALAVAQIIFRTIDQDNFLDICKETLAIFLLPFLVAIFYAMHVDSSGYVKDHQDYQNYLHQFNLFWASKWRTPEVAGLGMLITVWDRQWRNCTIVFLAIFILYLIAPLVNLKVVSRSFFFTSRQYLYFDLVFPLYTLMLAIVLPKYWDLIKNKVKIMGLF